VRAGYVFFGSMVEVSRRVKAAAAQLGQPSAEAIARALQPALPDPDAQAARAGSVSAAVAEARNFLLLDLRAVTGMDATAASEFGAVRRMLESRGVTLVLAGISRHASVRKLLISNNVVAADGAWEGGAGCPAFESVDAALVWCQEYYQRVAVQHRLIEDLAGKQLTLEAVLRMHLPHETQGGRATLADGEMPRAALATNALAPERASAAAGLDRVESDAAQQTEWARNGSTLLDCADTANQAADTKVKGWTWDSTAMNSNPLYDKSTTSTSVSATTLKAMDACNGAAELMSNLALLIERHMEMRTLARGEVLFDRGDSSNSVFVLLSGTLVSVVDLQRFGECALCLFSSDALQPACSLSLSQHGLTLQFGMYTVHVALALQLGERECLPSCAYSTCSLPSPSVCFQACRDPSAASVAADPRSAQSCTIAAALDLPTATNAPPTKAAMSLAARLDSRGKVRFLQAGPGSLVGDVDWVLRRPCAFPCLATSPSRVLALTRPAFERLAAAEPRASALVLQLLLQSSAVALVHAVQELGSVAL
jgi:CRP-like cAMP-binding protein